MRRRDFMGAAAGFAGSASCAWAWAHHAEDDDAEAARRWDADRRFLASPFGRIAYVERGRGPVALFLHGFPLSGFQWRGAFERLQGHRRCLAPDFLGLGHSEPTPGAAVTPQAQVAMLAALLDGLEVAEVDLIANDSGGAIAQLFSVRHPGRVRSLLLTNCDTEIDSPPKAMAPVIALAREGTYPDLWLAPWARDGRLARSPQGLGGMCFADPSHPSDAAIAQYLAPLVASPERKALVNRYVLGLTPNPLKGLEAQLRNLERPVSIVWGRDDAIFGVEGADYLRTILPQVRGVRLLPRAKLFFPEEYPDIMAAEALKLWNAG